MKKSKFTDSQILSILKELKGGTPVSELCREYIISMLTHPVVLGTALGLFVGKRRNIFIIRIFCVL